MLFTPSSWRTLAGQNDVQPTLHIPVVYESVPASQLRWEYRVVEVDTREQALPDDTFLNELGAQGWLLAGVQEQRLSDAKTRVHYYFVRQKEGE
jgi:hypothetical protein